MHAVLSHLPTTKSHDLAELLRFTRVSRCPEGQRENVLFPNVSGRVPAGHAGTVCFTMVSPMLRGEWNVFVLQWFPASPSGSIAFPNVYQP